MDDLVFEIKKLIIESLELDELSPEDIKDDEPLFNDGLGLDSIDALELGLALKKKFGIKTDDDKDANKKHFYSVKTLSDFVRSQTND